MSTPVAVASPGAGSPPPSPGSGSPPPSLTAELSNAEKAAAIALNNARKAREAATAAKAQKEADERAAVEKAEAEKLAADAADANRLNAEAKALAARAKAAADAKAAIQKKKNDAAALAKAQANAAVASAAAEAKQKRINDAATAEATEATAAPAFKGLPTNLKRGYLSNPLGIQVVDAAKKGNSQLLKRLIEVLSKDSNYVSKYDIVVNNALFAAASGGHRECVTFLLENKASPTIRDAERNTILHAAVKSLKTPEQIPEIRGIINDVHQITQVLFKEKNKNGETILHLAAKSPVKGSERIVNNILELEGADAAFVNSRTKNSASAIANGRTNGRTALELVHNLNATKVNNRGRAGRYPINSVNFKKAAALLRIPGVTQTITAKIPENAEVYPLLMKYYNKLNLTSGQRASIEALNKAGNKAEAEARGKYLGVSSLYKTAKAYDKDATNFNALAVAVQGNPTRKAKYERKAAAARMAAKAIRNARRAEAVAAQTKKIYGSRTWTGYLSGNNQMAAARAAAASDAALAATQARTDAAAPAAAAPAAAAAAALNAGPPKTLWQRFKSLTGRGGTRKNRSRKNKSTRKNRKH